MVVDISPGTQRWLARTPGLLNLLLVIAIALAGARLFWLLWPSPPVRIEATAQTSNAATPSNNSARVDIDTITGANLFGSPKLAAVTQQPDKIINAPETHLDLTLTGIVSNSDDNRSRALIENPDGEQGSYAVGDDIISGVKLHAIYTNKVILSRNGRYETLTLERIKKAQAIEQVAGDNVIGGGVAQQLGRIRASILANPAAARRYIRLQPARQNGSLIGYRIFPGPKRGLFKKAGLRPGAIVTAINGHALNSPATALRLLSQVATASQVTFTLQHNGRQRNVTVRFE